MSVAVALLNRLGFGGRVQDDVFEARLAALVGRHERPSPRRLPSPFKFRARQDATA